MQRASIHSLRAFVLGLLLALPPGVGRGTSAQTRQVRPSAGTVAGKVALIHFNPTLGGLDADSQSLSTVLDANIQRLSALVEEAFRKGANIVVTPELSTTGYSIVKKQVVEQGFGLERPFTRLNKIRDLAIKHRGYVFLGFAEARPPAAYNSVAVFGPQGLLSTGRKRGNDGWNTRGDVPFDVIPTRFGELGAIICADSYLPDWIRVLTLKGADIIVSPANWWFGGQDEIWQTRARENGVWMVIANRWGREDDYRFNRNSPSSYDMNDAPSDVISPDGAIKLNYRAMQENAPTDRILYYTIHVPANRIGTANNPTYTVAHRRPGAYRGIENLYYRRDIGYQPQPGLPPDGNTEVGAITYLPSADAGANLANLRRLWAGQRAEVVVLPGLGISRRPVESYRRGWANASPWRELQEFVDRQEILLLATTVREKFDKRKPARESVVVIQREKPARLFGQIHRAGAALGTGQSPTLIDLPHARVAVLTGVDALFPELSTHLVKEGVDLVLVTSDVNGKTSGRGPRASTSVWDRTALLQAWKTSTNHGFHLAASDSGEFGLIVSFVQGGGGYNVHTKELDGRGPVQVLSLDSAARRETKSLNAYYPFDLDALLLRAGRAVAK